MSQARKLGIKSNYIPNAKADMRFRKKGYQRGREIAERDRKMERVKADANRPD